MNSLKYVLAISLAFLLAACGGGGGSAGTPNSSTTKTTTTTTSVSVPSAALALKIVDSTGATVGNNLVSSAGSFFVLATLTDAAGALVPNKLVSFVSPALVTLTPSSGSVLTDANGVARIQIQPANNALGGAGTLQVSATVSAPATASVTAATSVVTNSLDFQSSAGPVISVSALALKIVDATGAVVSSNLVSTAGNFFVSAALTDATGAPVRNKLVTFIVPANATLIPAGGTVLTDGSGVALIQIQPASNSAGGAGTVQASAVVNSTNNAASTLVNASLDFRTTAGLSVSTSTLLPTIVLSIVDGSGARAANNAISSSGSFFVLATVKDVAGAAVANKLVTFVAPAALATLAPSSGAVLTDASGVARVQIQPASIAASGAGTLQASASVSTATGSAALSSASAGVAISTSLDFQTSPATVALTGLAASPAAIGAFQSAAVSVQGLVNGAPAAANSVIVNFTASCGTVSPASAPVNSSGLANVSYVATAACAGNVVLSAQAANGTSAAPVTANINVTAAKPANIQFTSALPALIVVSGNALGNKQSVVKFQVVDALGSGMSGQTVNLTLASSAISAGVTFPGGSTTTLVATSDASGFVTAIVSAGSLPTPLQVVATLASDATVNAASVGLAVTSGRPSQEKASIGPAKFSIEGFNVDGATTNVSFRVADRQSNPVPVNTPVTFVSEAGLITGSCLLDASSQCTVVLTSQGLRPSNGRVSVLAYLDGEESFIDKNGNNVYDAGETFSDMGMVYRDDNESGSYDVASEQTFPGGQTGTADCSSNANSYPSVANTCDGVWSSNIRVRQQTVVVFATSGASAATTTAVTKNGFAVQISDLNNNSMPTGSQLTVADVTTGNACAATISPTTVLNQTKPSTHVVTLNADPTCSNSKVNVTVTSPGGVQSVFSYQIP